MTIRFFISALFVSILMPLWAFADDTTAPVITPPADQTFATTTIPASPLLVAATATDDTDPAPVVTYTPQSFGLGTTTVTWTATDATGNFSTTTSQVGIYTPAVETATIKIYVGTTLATSAIVTLPASGSPDVNLTPTGGATPETATARSAIAVLEALDAQTTDFDVTQLDYFGFLGFQVSCVSIPSSTSTPLCTLFPPSWLFAINGSAPTVGMSSVELHDGDVMQLYYSYNSSRQAVVITPSPVAGSPFTIEVEELDPATGSYNATTGFTVDIGTVSGFTFTTLQSSPVNASGRATFTLSATGTYAVAVQEDFDFPSTSFVVSAPSTAPSGGGAGTLHYQLNVPSALAYLASKQNANGSFSSSLYTDWVAIAFAASDSGAAKTALRNYLLTASPALSAATDYERHAMALMALGIDPYTGTATNYITPIVNAFDGTQIGYNTLATDDIFALFPLLHAGYTSSDDIIKKSVAFILSAQTSSGGWDDSVDVTAAAVQALSQVSSLPNVVSAMANAENYLHTHQQTDGGFGNSFSTSWALQAIAALGESPSSWAPSGINPNDYLASLQQPDGGVDPTAVSADNRVWTTSYAIPAALGKTWNSLLSTYSRPANTTSGDATISATSTATSTIPLVATSTPAIATSTPESTATSTLAVPETTTNTATTTAKKPQQKVKIPAPKRTPPAATASTSPPQATPPTATEQTAAAANADGGFFGNLWHSITWFFSHLF